MIKSIFLLFSLFTTSICLFGQSGTDSLPAIRYIHKERVDELLQMEREILRKNEFASGYRLQIIFSTNKEEVNSSKVSCYKRFPQYRCYVEYEAPRYKLLLGDFRTRLDAYKAMIHIINDFPSAFIVKDQVLLKPL